MSTVPGRWCRLARVEADVMTEPDIALQVLSRTIKDFEEFVRAKGAVSESDTRVKLIDRILVQVCGWPEAAITGRAC